jgi:CO/xanthine dehydrogenase FAD-binding subunit
MPKLKAYHRPASLAEALRLLSRSGINTTIVAGGTYINAHMDNMVDEVIDLQAIGLTEVSYSSDHLTLGAMVRLQSLVEDSQAPSLLREAVHREGPNTLRYAATVGGLVVGASKESELLAALLVFEAEVQIQSTHGSKRLPLADFWRDVPAALDGGLVTAVSLAALATGKTASARVARTPADQPIVAAAARLDPSGQLHLALCGVSQTPILVDPNNVKAAVNPPGDFRGSSEYRRQMAATLARRVVSAVQTT